MNELTEDEYATIRAVFAGWSTQPATLRPAVEAILTARLTRVEALADEWETAPVTDAVDRGRLRHARALRAALAAAPSREGES